MVNLIFKQANFNSVIFLKFCQLALPTTVGFSNCGFLLMNEIWKSVVYKKKFMRLQNSTPQPPDERPGR